MPAAFDELTYEGISLGMGQKRTVEIEVVPTPDRRQTQYHRIKIEVDAVVVPSVGDTIEDIRRILTRNGGNLKATGIGIGFDLNVGGSASMTDVEGGPFPKLLALRPMAAANAPTAVEVRWSVEVCIFIAESSGSELEHIGSFSYSQSYSLDPGGWTTRTISGQLTVAKTFDGPNKIDHNADFYRDKLDFTKPVGYERSQRYELSADKATLGFTVTDTQIPTRNPYPPGVVHIEASHRVTKSRSQMATTKHSLSMRVEIAADQPMSYAWFIFQQIALRRIEYARGSGSQILVDQIDVEEDIFGTGVSASISYRTLGDMSNWLGASGLFSQLWVTWDEWEDSMHGMEHCRGISQLTPDPVNQDRLVNHEHPEIPEVKDLQIVYDRTTPLAGALCNPLPPPNASWAHFEAYFDIKQSALEKDQWIPLGPEVVEDGVINLNELQQAGRGSRAEIPSILPVYPGAATKIIYRGMAVRVGYEIPMPKLVIGNVQLKMIEKSFKPAYLGTFYCQPVFAAKWEIEYVCRDLAESHSAGILTDGTGKGGSSSYSGSPGNQPPNNP
jgi:hypothetical protein